MTRPTPFELTDALLERMLAEQAGPGAPAGFVGDVAAAVEATPQQRAGLLPRIAWPQMTSRRSTWLLVGVALLVGLTVAAALIGSFVESPADAARRRAADRLPRPGELGRHLHA